MNHLHDDQRAEIEQHLRDELMEKHNELCNMTYEQFQELFCDEPQFTQLMAFAGKSTSLLLIRKLYNKLGIVNDQLLESYRWES